MTLSGYSATEPAYVAHLGREDSKISVMSKLFRVQYLPSTKEGYPHKRSVAIERIPLFVFVCFFSINLDTPATIL